MDVNVMLGSFYWHAHRVTRDFATRAADLRKRYDAMSDRGAPLAEPEMSPSSEVSADGTAAVSSRRSAVRDWIRRRYHDLGEIGTISVVTGAAGTLAIIFELTRDALVYPPPPLMAGIAAVLCLCAAALASTVVHYLTDIDPMRLSEGPALARGARVVAWIFVIASVSMGLAWAGQPTMVRMLHIIVMVINAAVCYGLLAFKPRPGETVESFPLDFGVLSALGSRTNIFGSLLDRAEAAARHRSPLHMGAHGRPPQPGTAGHRPVSAGLALDVPDRRRR